MTAGAALVAAELAWQVGERFPLLLRLGTGVGFGQADDTRSGTLTSTTYKPGTAYSVSLHEASGTSFFHADPEIREILGTLEKRNTAQTAGLGPHFKYDKKTAAALKAHTFDAPKMAAPGFEYERLDQLTTEVLLGVR